MYLTSWNFNMPKQVIHRQLFWECSLSFLHLYFGVSINLKTFCHECFKCIFCFFPLCFSLYFYYVYIANLCLHYSSRIIFYSFLISALVSNSGVLLWWLWCSQTQILFSLAMSYLPMYPSTSYFQCFDPCHFILYHA